MSQLQNNLYTTIHLEALQLTTAPLMDQLNRRIVHIETQYGKEDLTDSEFKALQRNEEFIKLILSALTDYKAAITAISAENQQLRDAVQIATADSQFWQAERQRLSDMHLQTISILQDKFNQLSGTAA